MALWVGKAEPGMLEGLSSSPGSSLGNTTGFRDGGVERPPLVVMGTADFALPPLGEGLHFLPIFVPWKD